MRDYSQVSHHPAIEEIAKILSIRTQNDDLAFFRVIAGYFIALTASSMRAVLSTRDRGEIPVNVYALALSPSGTGKGYSVGLMEQEFLKGFRERFVDEIMPEVAETHLRKLSMRRAAMKQTEEEEEYAKLEKEFLDTGAYPFTFDSGSTPAVKQIRQQLLLANIGSINLQIDEIGSNLLNNAEVLTTFLELYDQGLVKQKLTKNTSDNKRQKELEGKTPANLMLFGTPSALFDGSKVEEAFYAFLETGYARRCIFAHGKPRPASDAKSAAQIYKALTDPINSGELTRWATHFTSLADRAKHGWTIDVPDDLSIELLQYKIDCENQAREMGDFDEVGKAEVSHRYFKALKLAGALAFVDEASQLQEAHLLSAIKLVEDSGKAFQQALTRERSYMKLARFIAASNTELTHADLHESLPFYKSGSGARKEMMDLATAWGYKQHIVIKKTFTEGIEFFSGETLKETSLEAIQVAYSEDFAHNYEAVRAPFDQMHQMALEPGIHWTNHGFLYQHRCEENVIPGFNMIVVDVDGEATLDTVHDLLQDYVFMTYTTKRHAPDAHRFRLLMPTNYELKLDRGDYREFMTNFLAWLPFSSDEGAKQASKKWLSNPNGQHHYNLNGELLDVLPFVPKTSKNERFQEAHTKLESLDNLERWFAQRIASGNRNNQMIKFALALVDSGMSYNEVEQKVLAFNDKLSNALPVDELRNTVLVTVARKLSNTP